MAEWLELALIDLSLGRRVQSLHELDIKWGPGLCTWGLSYRDGKEPPLALMQRSPLVSPRSTDLTRRQPIWYLVGQ